MNIKIPIYDMSTMSFDKDTINKLELPKNEYKNYNELFAIKITTWEKHMNPKYSINDIVIFEKCDDFNKADGCDCIIKIENHYTFRRVTIQNDVILLSLYDNNITTDLMTEPIISYAKDQMENIPIKIIGIAREKRTRL